MVNKTKSSLPPKMEYMGSNGIILLGLYFTFFGFFLIQNVVKTWPAAPKSNSGQLFKTVQATGIDPNDSTKTIAYDFKLPVEFNYSPLDTLRIGLIFYEVKSSEPISLELRYIFMVLLIGALGSWLHAVSSFVDFVGNRNFITSWVLWYIMRPFIGGVLALIFYMILRAGLLPVNVNGELPVSPYSVAAFAGLAGLFTQRATLKLAEVFDVIFSSATKHKDPLGKKLALTRLVPDTLVVNAEDMTVNIEGNDFTKPMKVFVKGQERLHEFKSKNLLTITLTNEDIKASGKLDIVVENANGERSDTLTLDVIEPSSES